MPTKETAANPQPKQPYRQPVLKVHGDFKTLTSTTKAGCMMDGAGKPMTRVGGCEA